MRNSSPGKVVVEITTRCNLRCRMCLKQAEGCETLDRDMDPDCFRRLLPDLGEVRSLVLSGIGEPLLHPRLEEMIAAARMAMPEGASIGLQSNGLLLDPPRAESLLAAGLSTVCLSLDSPRPRGQGEHDADAVAAALAALREAAAKTATAPLLGLETVLSAETIAEFPALVSWAAARGVRFILASHLLLYESGSEALDLFNPHPPAANQLYLRHAKEAAAAGIDLQLALANRLQLKKGAENRAERIFSAMQAEAAALDLRLHLPSLIRRHSQEKRDIERWLRQAEQLARSADIDLQLPPLEARWPPSCPFIEERAALIDVAGQVMPCHSLWHGHHCYMHGERLQVRPRSFGRLDESSLATIWQKEEFRRFRREAGEYRHAPCWNCSQGPCPTLINDDLGYANDCYGSGVPCGHCRWSLGAVRCL